MNYVGQKVKHSLFGTGEIVAQDEGNRVLVRFSDSSEKEFVAPKCFESFLVLLDASVRAEAKEHIAAQIVKEKAEAEAKKKEAWKKALDNAAEKNQAAGKNKEIKVKSFATVSSFFAAQKTNLEIEAGYVKATGGKRYRITDGELIAVSGDKYIYSFETETELSLPDNIPITLWKGDQSIVAALVNCEDFMLFIAVPGNIGNQVPELEFTVESWRLLYSLVDRLEEIRINPTEIVKSLILEGRNKVDFVGSVRKGQDLALKMSREEPILFIWGPPGTGKTETLGKMVLEHVASGEKVLMLSHSNVSVDEAALRVLSKDAHPVPGKLVRYGYPKRKEVLDHQFLSSYNLCLLQHPELEQKRRELIEKRKHLPKNSPQYLQAGKELKAIREQLRQEEKNAVKKAHFVATTVSKAIADDTLYLSRYDMVIFDEASMATIPQIIFAASLADVHFVCIGDFAQLPPIVQSDKASDLNADIFQYCGIVDAVESGYSHEWLCMLNVQHRMYPDIASFVSKRMYHNLLESASGMREKTGWIVKSNPVSGECLALADLSGMMSVCIKLKDKSRINVLSAMLSLGIAANAARKHNVGIITPYNAQSRLLHAMSRDLMDKGSLKNKITCATVHQFQGSEQDVIVYDAVDCYKSSYPGMLLSSEQNNYANRLFNVAMTRAKGKMVSLVNVEYMENKKLSGKRMFRQLIDMYSTESKRGKQILNEVNQQEIMAVADHSLDEKFLEDLSKTKSEVRIDIPGRMDTDSVMTTKLAAVLQKLNQIGRTVIIRAEHKQDLPAEIRPMAIENEYVSNPITLIDKEISWFGQPASGACFVAEGKTLPVWCRPVIRFEGKHCAKLLYSMLEMSSTIDMDDQMNEEGTYDTFSAYVSGELSCDKCGMPLALKKGKSGRFFLSCSGYPKCENAIWIEPEMVDEYLYFGNKNGRICPEDGTSLTAGKGKKNVYVSCNCGGKKHFWRLDEI